MRSLARFLLVSSTFWACSGEGPDINNDGISDDVVDPNNVSVIAPTRPKGFMAGEVIDAVTGLPLAGVSVHLIGGGQSAPDVTADAQGFFSFGPLDAGARFSVRLSQSGYVTATVDDVVIDDAAGNFPTQNGALFLGPIGMLPSTGKMNVQVVSEEGVAVMGAAVTVETSVRYFLRTGAVGSAHATGMTNAEGQVTIAMLPDVFRLPPRLGSAAALLIAVSPVDLDRDGDADLRGATLALSADEARNGARTPVVVLGKPGDVPLEIIASSVADLVTSPAPTGERGPAVIGVDDAVRLVFNLPIDRDSLLINIRDETGDRELVANPLIGASGNTVEINPTTSLEAGQEYNIAVRAQSFSSQSPRVVTSAAAFFVLPDTTQPIQAIAQFADRNGDTQWGTAGDELVVSFETPIGRYLSSPAFRARLRLNLDLDASGSIGDGTGELAPAGIAVPPPLFLDAAEPDPGNGAPKSGYTRFMASLPILLLIPLTLIQGPIDFELELAAQDNQGLLITDPTGRPAPARSMRVAALVR